MRFTEFQDGIFDELRRTPAGLTWRELRDRLRLPYRTPCPTWVARLEGEGLVRVPGPGRALVWKVAKRRR